MSSLALATIETLPKGICLALLSAIMERCGTNVQRPPNAVNEKPSRHRPVWNVGLTEEDHAYLRGWQSEMESFDRF